MASKTTRLLEYIAEEQESCPVLHELTYVDAMDNVDAAYVEPDTAEDLEEFSTTSQTRQMYALGYGRW